MKIGILGAGNIAGALAYTINKMENASCYAVASRDIKKAKEFAEEYEIPKAYGSYEEMLGDSEVELVYVATPHSHHYEHIKLCIEHNKHVLCEKAFTRNAVEAEEVLNLAKSRGVLVAEAIWTRYMPMRNTLTELLKSGIIGEPTTLTANLGYVISHVPRLIDPLLAGGALLDLGVYTLNFALMAFGSDIQHISSSVMFTDTGVDAQNSITIHYKDGKMANLTNTMRGLSDRKGIIYGTKGFIIVENINNSESITVYNLDREVVQHIDRPSQISGYEYQVEACMEAISQEKLECKEMPHEEILKVMRIMDNLRKEWGVIYPGE